MDTCMSDQRCPKEENGKECGAFTNGATLCPKHENEALEQQLKQDKDITKIQQIIKKLRGEQNGST